MLKGITEIPAFQCTDGTRYYELSKAERRQIIINKGDKPCNACDCNGQRWHSVYPHQMGCGYEGQCSDCNGHGYLIPSFIAPKLIKR